MAMLTAWESNTRLVALYAATGCLIGEHAQSVLLVGPYGQGKTEMIRRFIRLPTVRMMTDLTQFGIRRVCEEDVEMRIRHLAITEMDRLFARDKSTRSAALGLLTNLMTGDVGEEYIGGHKFDFRNRQLGVIAAMTSGQFNENMRDMTQSGMLSRFQVVQIDRTEDERKRVIHNIVHNQKADLTPIPWAALHRRIKVHLGPTLSHGIHKWLEDVIAPDERFTSRLLVLLKACAWLNGRTTVSDYDFQVVKLFLPYFGHERFVQLDWPFSYGRNGVV